MENEIPKIETFIRVAHAIKAEVHPGAIAYIKQLSDDAKVTLLHKVEKEVFELQDQLVKLLAVRDHLNREVNTILEKPHWVRHASIMNLHGEGSRLRPCTNVFPSGVVCGKMTEWSFDGSPRCSIIRDQPPTNASHAVCTVEAGTKKFATYAERDIFNMLTSFGKDRK